MAQDTTQPQGLTVQQAQTKLEAILFPEETVTDEPQQDAEGEEQEPQEGESESATDEPKAPAADAEPEDESADDAEETDEEPEETPPAPTTHKIIVAGEELEVTTDEALKGYMRNADYTRKTQELAAARKDFAEKELPSVREERKQYATLLTQLQQTLAALTPQEPDWAAIRDNTPEEFPQKFAEWQIHQKRLTALQQEQQQALQKVQEDQQQQYTDYLAAEAAKLVAVIPEFNDPEKGKLLRESLTAYAKNVGFSEEEIGAVSDHRALILLDKARRWDEAQKRRPEIQKRVQEVARVALPGAKPGAAPSVKPREVTEVTRAKQRLAKTGNVKDAAAVLDFMLAAEAKAQRRG